MNDVRHKPEMHQPTAYSDISPAIDALLPTALYCGASITTTSPENMWGNVTSPIQQVQLVVNSGDVAMIAQLLRPLLQGGGFLQFAAAALLMPGAQISHLNRNLTVDAASAVLNPLNEPREKEAPRSAPGAEHKSAEPEHSRLAREIREMSGLSASVIASALGVRREQFQRWIAGSAISDTRFGQLVYLHTIIRDLLRRLGDVSAKRWLHVPSATGITPAELLRRRRIDEVHHLVARLYDPMPVQDGKIVALPAQEIDHYSEEESSGDQPWSPYDESDK